MPPFVSLALCAALTGGLLGGVVGRALAPRLSSERRRWAIRAVLAGALVGLMLPWPTFGAAWLVEGGQPTDGPGALGALLVANVVWAVVGGLGLDAWRRGVRRRSAAEHRATSMALAGVALMGYWLLVGICVAGVHDLAASL